MRTVSRYRHRFANTKLAYSRAGVRYSLGSGIEDESLRSRQEVSLKFYQRRYPDWCVISRGSSDVGAYRRPNFLHDLAVFFNYMTIDRRRLVPCLDTYNAPNSIIQACFRNNQRDVKFVGQVVSIFQHQQKRNGPVETLLFVRWLRPFRQGVFNTIKWRI